MRAAIIKNWIGDIRQKYELKYQALLSKYQIIFN